MKGNLFQFALVGLLLAATTRAEAPALPLIHAPQSKIELCRRYGEARRAEFPRSLENAENQLAFRNEGGLRNGGVCWWHSRFTRAATYLAYYSPDKAIPSRAEAKKIISDLARQKTIVEIPGFRNLYEFSVLYQKEIQDELEAWQMRNAVRGAMRTINPLRRTSRTTDSRQDKTIQEAKWLLSDWKTIPYMLLQFPGIVAHAWLIVKIDPVYETLLGSLSYVKEYILHVIDSNAPGKVLKVPYTVGDNAITFGGERFAIYHDYVDDLDRIYEATNDRTKGCGWVIGEFYPGQRAYLRGDF